MKSEKIYIVVGYEDASNGIEEEAEDEDLVFIVPKTSSRALTRNMPASSVAAVEVGKGRVNNGEW